MKNLRDHICKRAKVGHCCLSELLETNWSRDGESHQLQIQSMTTAGEEQGDERRIWTKRHIGVFDKTRR
ncbi:hypothetical protein F2Q70_00030500 [Brassica cretica]|uniref:Uncharacterized protein n=1 Tax=Brassica cretica TaxID=69181 RepID=A0A3N6SDN8_BRACR|nr:hypothetical protein F2Q70_00030500 [Brassica cretica]KAF3592005.1 hypothetical protein DY000_02023092 [Brassica cretica]